jgi:hypothetical protein
LRVFSLKNLPAVFLLAAIAPASASDWEKLFNGSDLTGWKPLLDAPDKSIEEFVKTGDGTIHMYAGNVAPDKVPFGVLMTERSFERYHLRLEYKWGKKKFDPRAKEIRDAGLLYHIWQADKVWPKSVECQIQEGDAGDLIFLSTGGVSWLNPRPDTAAPGQGDAALLPESGGVPRDFRNADFGPMLGRYPVLDRVDGWNTVDLIVHGADDATHIVNGTVRSRVSDLRKPVAGGKWEPLRSGPIAIQLEGAELYYRNIEVRELPASLTTSSRYVSLSSAGEESPSVRELVITNPGPVAWEIPFELFGESPQFFTVEPSGSVHLEAGDSVTLKITFAAPQPRGRYSAGLQIGGLDAGAFVVLQGLRTEALEGGNEPSLATILDALGTSADVGGPDLDHDTKSPTLGSSVAGGWFTALGEVRVTPIARYSPPGEVPFGIQPKSGDAVKLGALAGSEKQSDAHQCLWPPLNDGAKSVSFPAPAGPFAIYAQADGTLSTVPENSHDAKVPVSARVWPISLFQGRVLENAFLVGFEEASNGDYQDALFLIENVALATP